MERLIKGFWGLNNIYFFYGGSWFVVIFVLVSMGMWICIFLLNIKGVGVLGFLIKLGLVIRSGLISLVLL